MLGENTNHQSLQLHKIVIFFFKIATSGILCSNVGGSSFLLLFCGQTKRKNRQVSWGLDIWTLELTWLHLSSKIIEVVSWPLTWVNVEKKFKTTGSKNLTTIDLVAMLLLQFFHVTRRFFEKKNQKKNRGTALLISFGSEKWKKKPEPDWAAFLFFSEVRTGGYIYIYIYIWTLDCWFFENRVRTGWPFDQWS